MYLPKPSANKKVYNQVMERGFNRFPKRKHNYELYQSSLREGLASHCNYLPVKMDYEVGSHCNFRCKMCLMSEMSENRPPNMTFEDFKNSIDEQIGLIEVKLQGMGEPLLNPDFFKMVELATEKDIWVRTTTNASLLHLKDNYKKMIDYQIGEIQISIDGATKETFEKIRVGSNFNQIVDNVTMLNEYAKEKDEQWRTSCWMLVQKDNVHEIEKLLELAHKMKFTRLTYSIAIGSWGRDDWEDKNLEKEVKDAFSKALVDKLINRGKELGIKVTFWDGKDKYIYDEKKDKLCAWVFSRAFISSDMRIVPCCVISDSTVYDLGDARKFSECWNAEGYKKIRDMHLSGKIPKMCCNCYE